MLSLFAKASAVSFVFGFVMAAQPHVELLANAEQKLKSGDYVQAEVSYGKAYQSAFDRVGVNPAERARIAAGHAEALFTLGNFQEAKRKADAALANQPDVPTRLRAWLVLSNSRRVLGEYKEARESYDQGAAEAKEKALNSLLAGYLLGRGELARLEARFDQATADLNAAAELWAKESDAGRLETAAAIAALEFSRELFAQAMTKYEAVIAAFPASGNGQNPVLARAHAGVAAVLMGEGRYPEAKKHLDEAEKACRELNSSPAYLAFLEGQIQWTLGSGNTRQASRDASILYDQSKELLGPNHPYTALALVDQGLALAATPAEELKKLQEAEGIERRAVGADHPDLAVILRTIGSVLRRNRDYPGAAARLTEAARIQRAALGEDSLALAETLAERAALYVDERSLGEAEEMYRQAARVQSTRLKEDHPRRRETSLRYGLILYTNGKLPEAGGFLESWWKARGAQLPVTNPDVFPVRLALSGIQLSNKAYPAAEEGYRELIKNFRDAASTQDKLAEIERGLGDALYFQDRFAEAIPLYTAAAPAMENKANTLDFWEHLATSQIRVRQPAKAAEALERLLALRAKQNLPNGEVQFLLADALLDAGRLEQAQPYLIEWMSGASNSAKEGPLVEKVLVLLASSKNVLAAEPLVRLILQHLDGPGAASEANLSRVIALLASISAQKGNTREAAQLYERSARRELALRRAGEAQRYLLLAKGLREKDSGNTEKELAPTLQSLARTYIVQRKYDDAEALLTQSKALIEKSDPPDPVQLALTLNGMGEVSQARAASLSAAGDGAHAQELFNRASQNFESAAKLLEKVPDAPRAVRAAVLFNQGTIAASNNQPVTETAKYFNQCLQLATNEVGREDPPPLEQLDGIAQFYVRSKQFEDAEALLTKALEIRRATFGENSAEYAWGLHAMADFYVSRAQYPKGIENGDRALKVFEKQAGAESDEVALVLGLLANAYGLSNDVPRAIQSKENALKIRRKSGHVGRDEEQIILADLGAFYREQRNYAKALEIYERQSQLWEPTGLANPNYQTALRNLAVTLEYTNAHERSQEVVQKLRPALKNQRNDDLRLLHEYIEALQYTGHVKEADKLSKEAKNLGARR